MRRPSTLALLALAAIVVIAGFAIGAGRGPSKVTLCAAKQGGALSAPKSGRCDRRERKLVVVKSGVKGRRGPTGPAGLQGQQGSPGTVPALAASPLRQVGPAGPDCAATLVFCSNGAGFWTNYNVPADAAVGYRTDPRGFVHIQGYATREGTGSGTPPSQIFVLPPGLRPSHALTFPALGEQSDWVQITINTDGVVSVSNGAILVTLGGISFHP